MFQDEREMTLYTTVSLNFTTMVSKTRYLYSKNFPWLEYVLVYVSLRVLFILMCFLYVCRINQLDISLFPITSDVLTDYIFSMLHIIYEQVYNDIESAIGHTGI